MAATLWGWVENEELLYERSRCGVLCQHHPLPVLAAVTVVVGMGELVVVNK